MSVKMTVTMSAAAGRRYGGRSQYARPVWFDHSKDAVADLRATYGGIRNQPDEEFLADLARVGIVVEIKD